MVSLCGLFSLLKVVQVIIPASGRVKFPGEITFSIKELCGSTESVADAITQALTKGKSEIADIGREARLKAFEHLTSIDAMVESLDRPSMLRIDPVLLLFGAMDAIRKHREEHTKPKLRAKRVQEEDGESTEIKRNHYEKVQSLKCSSLILLTSM